MRSTFKSSFNPCCVVRNVTSLSPSSGQHLNVYVLWISFSLGCTHRQLLLSQCPRFYIITLTPSSNRFNSGFVIDIRVNPALSTDFDGFSSLLHSLCASHLVIVQVWMALILAFVSVIATLFCLKRWVRSKSRSVIGQDYPTILPSVRMTESIFMYVVGILLNQGKILTVTFSIHTRA